MGKKKKSNFIVRGGADFSGIKSAMDKTQKDINGFGGDMKRSFGKIAKLAIAAFSVAKISKALSEYRNMFKEVSQTQTKLAATMRANMGANDESINSVLGLMREQQKVGVVSADTMTAGAQSLSGYIKDAEAMKSLIPIMNDVAVSQHGVDVSAQQMASVAEKLGKVMNGQTNLLARMGFQLTEAEEAILKTGTAQEKAAVISRVVSGNIGEMNKTLAETDVGRQKQLANAFADIKVQAGAAVNQIAVLFIPALQKLAEWLAKIANIARQVAQSIANLFGKGKTTEQADAQNAMANSAAAAAAAQNNLGKEIETAGKKAKKSLAAFDQLNILQDNTGDAAQNAQAEDFPDYSGLGGGVFEGGIHAPIEIDESVLNFFDKLNGKIDEIKKALEPFGKIIGNIFGESKTTALNFITETKTNFISWAAEVGESVGGIFSGAFARRTPEQVRETLETVGEIFNASVEGLTVIAGSAGGAAGELIKQGLTIGAHGFDIVQEAAFIFIDENGADIKDWATATSKTIANSFDNAKTVISVAGGVINNTLEKNKDEIAETFAGFGTSAAQAFMGYSKIGAETLETVTGVVAKFAVDNEDKLQDFTDNAVEIFTVMGGTVNKISQETTEKVLEHWDNGGRDTVESVAEMATDVGGWFLDLSNEFVMPAVVEMFTEMENIWDRSLGDVVSETFGFVSDIGVLMKLLWDDYIKPVIDWLLSYIIPRIMNFATTVIGTVGWIVSAIGESIKGFIGIFRGLIQFFTGIFSGDWEKAWEGIKKVFTSIWDAIKGVVLSIVNAIIGLINGLVRSVVNGINAVIGIINKVNFTIPDWVPGIGGKEIGWSVAPVEAPQIPYLAFAQGGVVDPNDPFLAMLGDNRHEQEVVSPLSTIKQALAEALQEASGGGQNVTIEFTGSGAELVELLAPKIIDRANSLSAQYGYSVVRA